MSDADAALLDCDLPLANPRRGKVRMVYDGETVGGEPVTVLIATDRLSAFDVVMPTGVPGKGELLTRMAAFWFGLIGRHFGKALRHHLLSTDPDDLAGVSDEQRARLRGRLMLGRRCRVVPIECIARGYLAGSGWAEYQRSGTVCGVELPPGLREGERLAQPIFTPATKAATGHDENIPFERACDVVGGELMHTLRQHTLDVYRLGHDHAEARGVILADTKLEFGLPLDAAGGPADGAEPILIDEVLTPDSSRFWPAEGYAPGRAQPSFDKQFVRDYLQGLADAGEWDKQPPGPTLPDELIARTAARYAEAFERLTGEAFRPPAQAVD